MPYTWFHILYHIHIRKVKKERDFMGIFSRLFKSGDKPRNSYDSPSYSYIFGRSNSGKRVNDWKCVKYD